MKKRVFVAINLPLNIKEKLVEKQKEIDHSFSFFNGFCPVKWTKKDNLHITLLFLGNIEMEDVFYTLEKTEEIAEKINPFETIMNKIEYFPYNNPRMIWVKGEEREELKRIQKHLDKELFNRRSKEFSPHLTLGRIRQWQFKKIEKEEIPCLGEINLKFRVNSLEVMESELKRNGSIYTILKSFPLKA